VMPRFEMTIDDVLRRLTEISSFAAGQLRARFVWATSYSFGQIMRSRRYGSSSSKRHCHRQYRICGPTL